MADDKTGVQSVERIFKIIELLASHPGGASLQQLSAESGLAKSTTHRLLGSLVQLGYAAQDTISLQYRLTLRMFEISSNAVGDMNIMNIAKPHLDKLAVRTGEAVHLVVRDGVDIVYIYKTESGNSRMSSRVGRRSPLYCTGVGKAILATLSYDEVEAVWQKSDLQPLTNRTVTSLSKLFEQLSQIRAQGYAIDDEENELGVRCVAAAVPGPGGKAGAAFSISGLVPHMEKERVLSLAHTILVTRQDILRDLGLWNPLGYTK